MKFPHQLALSTLAVVMLSGCAGGEDHRRRAMDDFRYLDTPALEQWQVPADAQPQFYPEYQIPQGNYVGGVGEKVDIRPPQQVLALLPGARFERADGDVRIWVASQDRADELWQGMLPLLTQSDIKFSQAGDTISTDWVEWNERDESLSVEARYTLQRVNNGSAHGIAIALVDWRAADGSTTPSLVEKERHTVFLTNLLTSKYDQQKREEAQRLAQERIKHIPIYMGTDRSGLPVIIARAPYDVVWQRLPDVIPTFGLTIEERNQSQGTIVVKYKAPDDEYWQNIGADELTFDSKPYTLQLGDLGNRTSLSVADADGKPIEASLLTQLENVLRLQMAK